MSTGNMFAHQQRSYWHRLFHGDVRERWLALMRLLSITDDESSMKSRKRHMLRANIAYVAVFLFTCIRLGVSGMTDRLPHHIFGHTLINTGNVNRMFMLMALFVNGQLAMYRLICIRGILSQDTRLAQVLDGIMSEADEQLRRRKTQMADMVYAGCLMSSINYFPFGVGFMSGLLYYNIHLSSSSSQVIWWSFCWTQDMILIACITTTMMSFPASWLLLVLDYRINLTDLLEDIKQLSRGHEEEEDEGETTVNRRQRLTMSHVMDRLRRLQRESELLNHSAAPIMFVINLCTTTITCISLFAAVFSDTYIFKYLISGIGLTFMLLPITLQAVAGLVTSKSQQLVTQLTVLAVRQRHQSMRMRVQLLTQLETLSSDREPLAIRTSSGESCTSLSFYGFLIEMAIQFTLFYSFSSYLHMHVTL